MRDEYILKPELRNRCIRLFADYLEDRISREEFYLAVDRIQKEEGTQINLFAWATGRNISSGSR
uniref:Uncharacterized protein n=1 Tax=viral metagenome TaxID=1070528 RepID=A0A6M3LJ35_9ZZZZ